MDKNVSGCGYDGDGGTSVSPQTFKRSENLGLLLTASSKKGQCIVKEADETMQ